MENVTVTKTYSHLVENSINMLNIIDVYGRRLAANLEIPCSTASETSVYECFSQFELRCRRAAETTLWFDAKSKQPQYNKRGS